MSSSNEVQIAYIEESVYGEVPGAGNFEQARFTSDALNASPETVESAQIRTDRLSSGQVLTGLTIGGEMPVEFAKATDIDNFIEAAMMDTWVSDTPVSVDLDIDTTAGTITRSTGDFNTDVVVGDVIILSAFSNAANNEPVMVTAINSSTVIAYAGPTGLVDETGSGTAFVVGDKVGIGTSKKSFSIEKKFNDLTTKGIIYNGMYVDGFNVTAAYGEIVTGAFNFVGADYTVADTAGELITNARTVNAAATSTSLNGSIDMAFLASSDGGTFSGVDFCVQSIDISLANNNTAQNCVGKIGPDNYSLGTAAISVSISAYLSDNSWSLLDKKLDQTSFAIGFILKNSSGFYAFYMPAVQVAFDDPASGGQNTDIILDMSGVAKVGPNSEKSLYVYKSL